MAEKPKKGGEKKQNESNSFSRRDLLKLSLFGGAGLLAGCQITNKDGAEKNSDMQNQATNITDLSNVSHRNIKIKDINLYVAAAGAGFPVIFLHGFPELWYSWRHQIPVVAAAGFHAVAPDLRGFGESDAPPDVESYSTKNRAADVIGLLDALNAEKCALVGHDWGANLAWACAQLYPERIFAESAAGGDFVLTAERVFKLAAGGFETLIENVGRAGVVPNSLAKTRAKFRALIATRAASVSTSSRAARFSLIQICKSRKFCFSGVCRTSERLNCDCDKRFRGALTPY